MNRKKLAKSLRKEMGEDLWSLYAGLIKHLDKRFDELEKRVASPSFAQYELSERPPSKH
jgi:hypothetical protein